MDLFERRDKGEFRVSTRDLSELNMGIQPYGRMPCPEEMAHGNRVAR
jgi:hypothetical protein